MDDTLSSLCTEEVCSFGQEIGKGMTFNQVYHRDGIKKWRHLYFMTLTSYRQRREDTHLRSGGHCQIPGFIFKQGTFSHLQNILTQY